MKCDKCQAGPSGMVGHFDLFLSRLDRDRMQFRCVACGSLWIRTSRAEQPLVWRSSETEINGLSIPGFRTFTREKAHS